MRIEIEIPKEYEDDYNADRFSDFFSRAMIDIETMQGMCGRYEIETAEMLQKAFSESKVAYDVEAKVAELEKLKDKAVREYEKTCCTGGHEHDYADGASDAYDKAISIVRGKE